MPIIIFQRGNPGWSHDCYYIRETDTKYIVWGNTGKTIEFHYPKHTHYYEERKEDE